MKKILIFAIALLALLFIGRQLLVPKIAERGFERTIAERIGAMPSQRFAFSRGWMLKSRRGACTMRRRLPSDFTANERRARDFTPVLLTRYLQPVRMPPCAIITTLMENQPPCLLTASTWWIAEGSISTGQRILLAPWPSVSPMRKSAVCLLWC